MASPPETETLTIGPLRLQVPRKWEALTSQSDPERAWKLAEGSPDFTVYHTRAYLEFATGQGADCALLVARPGGELLFGMTIHARGADAFVSGYNGLLLPRENSERALKKSVGAFHELLRLNPHVRQMALLQSPVSSGGGDPERRAIIDSTLTCGAPEGSVEQIFTRVLPLDAGATVRERTTHSGELTALDESLLKKYDGDLRNQIRQAGRHGVGLRFFVLAGGATHQQIEDAYAAYLPVHAHSWSRTGMEPHSGSYWHALSRAIVDGGGVDLLMLASFEGKDIAGVTCHLFGAQAIYWSGASLGDALPKRANPLCLHAAISLCRELGVRRFELGRFHAWQDEKTQNITHYKAQFGGLVHRVPNLHLRTEAPVAAFRRLGLAAWRRVVAQSTVAGVLQRVRGAISGDGT